MNVNIVLRNSGTHIIPRMMQWLADGNGWTISDKPDESADVNYYATYLAWDLHDHPNTLTAAWFTHHEDGTPWKVKQWEQASYYIDAPLVTAPLYCAYLEKAQVITPGIDRDFWQRVTLDPHDGPPVIGIAGQGQPRKGPHQIVDLFYSPLNVHIQIVGDAWPFPFNALSVEQMPIFYSHIDAYLCTSTIEGIPAPVLEALSCGTPVVVPDGVGICEMLPEMPGIRHYKAGDSKDMIRALRECLKDVYDPDDLRRITQMYSIDEWCKSNRYAVEALVDAAVPV